MSEIIRFYKDYTTNRKFFAANQEWEYHDKYTGMVDFKDGSDTCLKPGIIYRIKIDSEFYHIPETVVVEGSTEETKQNIPEKNIAVTTTAEDWDKRVTTDAITYYYGSYDFVKAAKIYLGKDIAAKKRADQADYATGGRTILRSEEPVQD